MRTGRLVGLAAVLLGVAAGIAIGSGPLSRAGATAVSGSAPASGPGADASQPAAQRASAQLYADATEPLLERGELANRVVVLLVAPGTPGSVVDDVGGALRRAGAAVTGQVRLTGAWTDSGQTAVLTGISDRLARRSVLPPQSTQGPQRAAVILASTLLGHGSGVGRPAADATALLTGLVAGGFVQLDGRPDVRASAAVLLVPAKVSADARTAVLPLGPALAQAARGGAVVAGPTGSAEPAGPVAAVRADPALSGAVSTVDDVDGSAGRVALVLALREGIAGQGPGHYGTGRAAQAPVPQSG